MVVDTYILLHDDSQAKKNTRITRIQNSPTVPCGCNIGCTKSSSFTFSLICVPQNAGTSQIIQTQCEHVQSTTHTTNANLSFYLCRNTIPFKKKKLKRFTETFLLSYNKYIYIIIYKYDVYQKTYTCNNIHINITYIKNLPHIPYHYSSPFNTLT